MDPKLPFELPLHENEPPNTGGPKYNRFDGHNHIMDVPEEVVRDAMSYKVRDDDVIIVTYPKTGTTWTQQIVTLIYHGGEVPEEVKKWGIYSWSPFLELQGSERAEKMPRPFAIKTHFPFHLQPWNPKAKYIVVIRNPKDVCVSYYHHTQLFESYQFKGRPFDDFFEYYINGEVEQGCYFDWYLSWWPHRDKENVKFFVYEEMKKDPKKEILKMAEFLGKVWADSLTANGGKILDRILTNSDIKYMKVQTNQSLATVWNLDKETFSFVRKGQVGDWKNYLNPEQSKRLQDKFREKFTGTGMDKLWDSFDSHPDAVN
ncbi:Sulfotransferase 1C2 [Halotydeus destructor]|nr:Sulfotransferase 1C2 [Halotydeus destructor]